MDESTISLRPRTRSRAGRTHWLYMVLDAAAPAGGSIRIDLGDVDGLQFGRARAAAVRAIQEGELQKLIVERPDSMMSQLHARLSRSDDGWTLEDADSKNGTVVNGVRVPRARLSDGDLIELGGTFFLFAEGPTLVGAPAVFDSAALKAPAAGLATILPELSREIASLVRIAATPVSVIVLGESGTGKEIIARGVHALSQRSGAFMALNCGGLPESLVQSELFGYRKGAFSGATEDRPGLVRAADGGTLFLDEIGDLPAASQGAFLRVLQEREVLPVGGTRAVPVDIRLVAATHRNMDAQVADGKFRGDLLARISGHTIRLPRLRDRLADLGLLIAGLLARQAPESASRLRLTPEAARALFRYEWPFNIRELEKALGRALALAGDEGVIELEHLPDNIHRPLDSADDATETPALSEEDVQRREQLVALLKTHGGNISHVARAMGKARMQVQRWIKRYRIVPDEFSG